MRSYLSVQTDFPSNLLFFFNLENLEFLSFICVIKFLPLFSTVMVLHDDTRANLIKV